MDKEAIGLAIGARREELGISQAALAKSVGLSRPYITQIETGKKKPSDDALIRIMAALNMTDDSLWSNDASQAELAVFRAGMPIVAKLKQYLTNEQFIEISMMFEQTQEAITSVQAHLKDEPMPSGPDGWLNLSKEDRRLVQRIVNRLLKGKEQ